MTTFERRPPLVWRGINMSREMDDFALPLLPLTNINFANPPFMLFSLYRALQMKEKEKMKRKQGANTVAHPWGIWHAVFSLKPSGPQPKLGGARPGKIFRACNVLFFLSTLPCFSLFAAAARWVPRQFFPRAGVFRWPRWERRRGSSLGVFKSFHTFMFFAVDTRIAYYCSLFSPCYIAMTTLLKTRHLA